jgi:aryl-alcohol dehydrogenase
MLNVVQPKSDSIVCVVGVGAVGLSALIAIKLAPLPPAKVIAVDVVSERLELAKKYGATDLVNSLKVTDLKASLLAVTDGKGIDGSIDATGRPDVIGNLLKATAKKGKVVTVGVGKASNLTSRIINSCSKYRLTIFLLLAYS